MTTSLLKDLLLITNPKVLGLSNYLNQTALLFVLPAFYIGIISEFFTNFDFAGVSKRAIVAFLAIKLLTPIHIEVVDQSLEVSSQLIRRYSPQNKFLTAYQQAKGDVSSAGKTGVWEKLTSIVKMLVNDPIVMVIFLLSYIAFFLLTQLYSLTYHLTIAMFGLCALLSILPMTSGSLKGAIKSSLWCMLMPFVVAIILCLIGDSDAFFKTYSGGIVQNLESLIQLFIMTIILLLAPLITSKIMSDSGVSHMAENLGQMAGMATMIGGASVVSNVIGGKIQSMGSSIHNSTTGKAFNKIKDKVSNKAQAISSEKGIGPSINSLTSKSSGEKLKSGLNDFKDNFKATSFKEKVILGADSIINKKENALAKEARSNDVKNSNVLSGGPNRNSTPVGTERDGQLSRNTKVPLSSYKMEAGSYLKNRNELVNRPKLHSQFLESRPKVAHAQAPKRQLQQSIPAMIKYRQNTSEIKSEVKRPIRNLNNGGASDYANVQGKV